MQISKFFVAIPSHFELTINPVIRKPTTTLLFIFATIIESKETLQMECQEEKLELPPPWNRIFPLVTRLTVWGILAGAVYILSSFFLLMFLTFVFAYIQSSGVMRLRKFIPSRLVRVIVVGLVFLSTLAGISLFIFPKVQRQTEGFVRQFATYIGKVDDTLLDLSNRYPILSEVIPELKKVGQMQHESPSEWRKSPTLQFFQDLTGFGGEKSDGYKNIDQILDIMGDVGGRLASIASAFLLSLLFSFLIVWDMPRLAEGVRGLRETRIRFIYDEVANNIYEFSHVMGQALEAQFLIALCNTLFTGIGIYLLGLGKSVAFLSVIVFFCSFIPVIGVFISSVPICLMALQTDNGLQTMFFAILLIFIIHMIEGYILNPRIYGSRMHINPVIVLILLTISGKLFHFWGLILSVPVCTYLFTHAIRFDKGNSGNTETASD